MAHSPTQINRLTLADSNYPRLLLEIDSPPKTLYISGNIDALKLPALAVVGSRKMSSYAKEVIPRLLEPMVDSGVCIVSGLAYGVDAFAHMQATNSNKPTIAVLGTPIDQIYPREHSGLAEAIIKSGGCIISEYAPGATVYKTNFVARNRIIAGLSKATLVVECAEKSGALSTANFALDYNRELLAVPANINLVNAAGTNKLIKQGACVVTEAQDLLDALGMTQVSKNSSLLPTDLNEALILKLLSDGPKEFDELAEFSKLSPAMVLATLTHLEVKGLTREIKTQTYSKA